MTLLRRSDPGREALEALVITGYRSEKFTHHQAARLLGLTRFEFDWVPEGPRHLRPRLLGCQPRARHRQVAAGGRKRACSPAHDSGRRRHLCFQIECVELPIQLAGRSAPTQRRRRPVYKRARRRRQTGSPVSSRPMCRRHGWSDSRPTRTYSCWINQPKSFNVPPSRKHSIICRPRSSRSGVRNGSRFSRK